MGVVECSGKAPTRGKTVVDSQLGVLLGIVVGLVGIIDRRVVSLAIRHGVFASRVIASIGSIAPVRYIVRHAFPSHAGLLSSAKSTENDMRLLAVPTDIAIETIQVTSCAIEETIGVHFSEASIHHPTVADRGVRIHHLTEGIVHTSIKCYGEAADAIQHIRLHIQRCTKCRTAGTGTHTALYVHLRDR